MIKIEIEEVLRDLKQGKEIVNEDWNGMQQKGKIMYIRKDRRKVDPSKITEPFIEMVVCTAVKTSTTNSGWDVKRFPWTPSQLDMFSDKWLIRGPDKKD